MLSRMWSTFCIYLKLTEILHIQIVLLILINRNLDKFYNISVNFLDEKWQTTFWKSRDFQFSVLNVLTVILQNNIYEIIQLGIKMTQKSSFNSYVYWDTLYIVTYKELDFNDDLKHYWLKQGSYKKITIWDDDLHMLCKITVIERLRALT